MKYLQDSLDRLPELPLEMFERSAKLVYSDKAPVLTVKPDTQPAPDRPRKTSANGNVRTQVTPKRYNTWVTYPYVVCYPWTEPEAVAAVEIRNDDRGLRQNEADPMAIAESRLYYKLTRFQGRDLTTPWGCVVHYGPYLAIVHEMESCFIGQPSRWSLYVPNLDLKLEWDGTWEDIPSFPNLNVIMGALSNPVFGQSECCPGFTYCPTLMACIDSQLKCHPPGV